MSALKNSLVAVVALGIALSGSAALAHNAVLDEQPVRDSIVAESPITVAITTNDALLGLPGEGQANAIAVQDPSGAYFGDGCVVLGDKKLEATFALGDAGLYTVTYQFVSADGHSVSDSYTFTFEPATTHVPARGVPEPPQCGEEVVSEVDETDATPEPTEEPMVIATLEDHSAATTNPWLIAAGSAVAASALALLVVGLQRRAKR